MRSFHNFTHFQIVVFLAVLYLTFFLIEVSISFTLSPTLRFFSSMFYILLMRLTSEIFVLGGLRKKAERGFRKRIKGSCSHLDLMGTGDWSCGGKKES